MSYDLSLIVLLSIVVLVLAAGLPLYVRYKHALRLKMVVVTGFYFGIVGGVLLVHTILFWPDLKDRIYAELACIAGASLGWLFGMWLSPLGANESTKFSKYWTAIGLGSGLTIAIRWLNDHITQHADWFVAHAFIVTLFLIALLVTTAAVYNSRAYEDGLTIAPRTPLAEFTTVKGETVAIKAGTVAVFYAAVVGPNDPLSKWTVFPPALGTIDDAGVFQAAANAGTGKITAFNVEDPTLSGALQVEVFVAS